MRADGQPNEKRFHTPLPRAFSFRFSTPPVSSIATGISTSAVRRWQHNNGGETMTTESSRLSFANRGVGCAPHACIARCIRTDGRTLARDRRRFEMPLALFVRRSEVGAFDLRGATSTERHRGSTRSRSSTCHSSMGKAYLPHLHVCRAGGAPTRNQKGRRSTIRVVRNRTTDHMRSTHDTSFVT